MKHLLLELRCISCILLFIAEQLNRQEKNLAQRVMNDELLDEVAEKMKMNTPEIASRWKYPG